LNIIEAPVKMCTARSTHGERRSAHWVSTGKPEEKGPLERPRRRWENNTKMDLRKVAWDDIDWIHLAQVRGQWRSFVSMVMNLQVL
jgi:hypothetical protein